MLGGAQQDRLEGGAISIVEAMKELLKDKVHVNSRVKCIKQENQKVFVQTDHQNSEFDVVICCVPINQVLNIKFEPFLEPERIQELKQFEIGNVIKIGVVYQQPFWRKSGLSGEVL